MPELILLCAGAALDRSSDHPHATGLAIDPRHARAHLAAGTFAGLLRRGRVIDDRHDDALVPRDLPENIWLRERLELPAGDALEAHAAWSYGLAPGSWLLTPSHVTIGLDHALLIDPSELELNPDESQALADVAAQSLSEHGFRLFLASPHAWFLHGERELNLQAHGWRMAAGRNVDAYLPSGPDARLWRRMLSEVQMLWHQNPVNLAREQRGAPPVNMLWLEGRATRVPTRSSMVLWSRNEAIRRLVQASGGQAPDTQNMLPAPDEFALLTALALQQDARDLVVELSAWSQARRRDDSHQWLTEWQRFDACLRDLALPERLPATFSSIRVILTGERRRLELQRERSTRWKLWRRLDPLAWTF